VTPFSFKRPWEKRYAAFCVWKGPIYKKKSRSTEMKLLAGWEVYSTRYILYCCLYNCLHKRMATLSSSACMYSLYCYCRWNYIRDDGDNVNSRANCLCRSWKCCETNSWSHQNSKTQKLLIDSLCIVFGI